MSKRERRPKTPKSRPVPTDSARLVAGLRIIGGQFRGRKLHYSGDLRTRPMKDRLREAIFNLLGPAISGTHAVDLFAGTGALALEALSRGADRATLVEQHHPTANIIRRNITALGVQQQAEVVPGNVFIWWRRQARQGRHAHACRGHEDAAHPAPPSQPNMPTTSVGMVPVLPTDKPWAVFCSPPYDFYVDRADEVRELIVGLIQSAPAESMFVVETDGRFEFQTLPDPLAWDIRPYPPAVVGIYRKVAGG